MSMGGGGGGGGVQKLEWNYSIPAFVRIDCWNGLKQFTRTIPLKYYVFLSLLYSNFPLICMISLGFEPSGIGSKNGGGGGGGGGIWLRIKRASYGLSQVSKAN